VRWNALHHDQLPMEALMNKAMKTVLMLTAMLAAGCSEGTVAPRADAPSDQNITGGGSTASVTGTDTLRFAFAIDPSRTITYYLGAGNTITFPAHSLCDPKTSTYGTGQWDKPCNLATQALTVNTKAWLDRNWLLHVDFDKQIRFVPTSNPAGWVMLSLTDYGSVINPLAQIKYCHSSNGTGCINEALTDPTLATIKDPLTGRLTRRVKHFSGYSITAGGDCDPMNDPGCDSGSMTRVDSAAVKISRP
jgi:hypothetical protein